MKSKEIGSKIRRQLMNVGLSVYSQVHVKSLIIGLIPEFTSEAFISKASREKSWRVRDGGIEGEQSGCHPCPQIANFMKMRRLMQSAHQCEKADSTGII